MEQADAKKCPRSDWNNLTEPTNFVRSTANKLHHVHADKR